MDAKKIQARLPETLTQLNFILKEAKMDAGDMLDATTFLMTVVKEYPELSGKERKKLVEDTIKAYLEKNTDEEKALLKKIFVAVVPKAIDLLVDVAAGKYKFKKAKKIFAWLSGCF